MKNENLYPSLKFKKQQICATNKVIVHIVGEFQNTYPIINSGVILPLCCHTIVLVSCLARDQIMRLFLVVPQIAKS